MIRRVASVLLVGGLMAPWASAQTAPAPTQPPAPAPAPARQVPIHEPIPTDQAHPNYHAGAHRTLVRHAPLRRPTSYTSYYRSPGQSSSSYYSNGGIGRYSELYDANTPTDQVDRHSHPAAQFGVGGGPDRNEQIAAQQIGQQRARNIQNDINAYGTPYGAMGAGFGYGLGLSGGRLYNYPY